MAKLNYKIPLILVGVVAAIIFIILQQDLSDDFGDNGYDSSSSSAYSRTNSVQVSGNFRPSGKSIVKTGRSIRDNKLLNETTHFKADKTGMADVNALVVLNEKGATRIYFHFTDSYGFEQRSSEFSVPENSGNHTVWFSKKLRRGSWKVTVRAVGSDSAIAFSRFTVKSDLVKNILDGSGGGNSDGNQTTDAESYIKIGSYANGQIVKEANIIKAQRNGYGNVYVVGWVIHEKATSIFFHFVDEYNNQRRSKYYYAPVNPKGYRIWIYNYLHRGKWTIYLKNQSNKVLASAKVLVK